jgi:hypothetical protein
MVRYVSRQFHLSNIPVQTRTNDVFAVLVLSSSHGWEWAVRPDKLLLDTSAKGQVGTIDYGPNDHD